MKLYCYWTSFCISFIWFPVFWFLKWTETWTLDFCIFNLRWPPGALIRLFASFKYFGSLIQLLQNFQEKNWMATNLTHLKYNWSQHNWLVFVVFLIYNFHFSSRGEEINWFLVFRLIFTWGLRFYLPLFSQMLAVIVQEWKFCCICMVLSIKLFFFNFLILRFL